MEDASEKRNRAFQEAFEKMHSQGVSFPSLVLDMLKHHKHSVASISLIASEKLGNSVSEHQVRSCLHGRIAANKEIRDSIEQAIGFDPWSVVERPNFPETQREIDKICRTVNNDNSSDDTDHQ